MITLVLGGARSGKSEVAERICYAGLPGLRGPNAVAGLLGPNAVAGPNAAVPSVTYVATGVARDDDMAARIAAHRARRPATWTTVEAGPGDVVDVVRSAGGTGGTLLLDSLTTLVAEAPGFALDLDGLCAALVDHDGDAFVVSDEVGFGVHPSTDAGRRFRDQLGLVNQAVAVLADRALLVVAGRVLRLDRPAETS